MINLSAEQVAAFKTNSGFTAEQLSTLILCVLFAVLIVWGVWAIMVCGMAPTKNC